MEKLKNNILFFDKSKKKEDILCTIALIYYSKKCTNMLVSNEKMLNKMRNNDENYFLSTGKYEIIYKIIFIIGSTINILGK